MASDLAGHPEWQAVALDAYDAGVHCSEIARRSGVSRERVRQVLLRERRMMPRDLLCAVEKCPMGVHWPDAYCPIHLRRWGLYGDPLASAPRKCDEHGTLGCYRIRKCRCQDCTTANRLFGRDRSARLRAKGARDPRLVPHGTTSGYTNWACRCDPCFEAEFHRPRQVAFVPSVRKGRPLVRP
jgi:hypothetical protein